MNTDILTTKSKEVLAAAITAATRAGHAIVEPVHLLIALLGTEGSTTPGLLRAVGADPVLVSNTAAGILKAAGVKTKLAALLNDSSEVLVYCAGELQRRTVAELAGEALACFDFPPAA